MWTLFALTALAAVTDPLPPSQESPSITEVPLRVGGDPSASEWWRAHQRVEWERTVEIIRWNEELEPGSCFSFRARGCEPERPPAGENLVRHALRSAFARMGDVPSPMLVTACMESRVLTQDEAERLLHSDDVAVAEAVLRSAAKEQDHRWLTRGRLIQIADHGGAPELRLAALTGLARHLECLDFRVVFDGTLEKLLDFVRDPSRSVPFRSMAATLASLNFRSYQTKGTDELWRSELVEALLEGLDPAKMGRAPGWERACADALIRISADASFLGSSFDRRGLLRAFGGRMAAATEPNAFGEALVRFAMICSHGSMQRDPSSKAESLALGARLISALETCEVEEGAWVTLALAHLIIGQVNHQDTPKDWARVYQRQLERAEGSGRVAPYIPSYATASFSRQKELQSWALATPSPEERGRRLFCIAQAGAYRSLDWKLYVDESTKDDPKFWRHAAPVIATFAPRASAERPVADALRYGRAHGWSAEDQAPLIDALGMTVSDRTVLALLEVVRNESPGTPLHDRASLSLGRIFEVHRADIRVHPLRHRLYPHPAPALEPVSVSGSR